MFKNILKFTAIENLASANDTMVNNNKSIVK